MLPFVRMFEYGNIAPAAPSIKKIDGSQLHVGLLYGTGKMYMRGQGFNYKLGTGNANNVYDGWVSVPYSVADFWACGYGTLLRSTDNKLYACGRFFASFFGQTGSYLNWTEVTHLFVGIDVSGIKNIKFTNYSSDGSTLILMQDGSLYGFGSNIFSELGTGNAGKVVTPILISTGVSSIGSNGINTPSFHYIKNGKYYRCGVSNGSNLGSSNLTTFTVLDVPETIISMQVLDVCTILLCSDSNNVYSFYIAGSNGNGSRGVGGKSVYTTFTKVSSSLMGISLDVSSLNYAGNGMVNITSNYAAVYTCGGSGLGRPVSTTAPNTLLSEVQFSDGSISSNIEKVYSQSSSGVIYCIINDILYWAGERSYFTDQTSESGEQTSFIKMNNVPLS